MAEQITITVNDDGTFTVAESEDDTSTNDQPLNETVDSVDAVCQLIQQALGDEGMDAQAEWDRQAQQRQQAPTEEGM